MAGSDAQIKKCRVGLTGSYWVVLYCFRMVWVYMMYIWVLYGFIWFNQMFLLAES